MVAEGPVIAPASLSSGSPLHERELFGQRSRAKPLPRGHELGATAYELEPENWLTFHFHQGSKHRRADVAYAQRVITAVHTLIYSDDPEATRSFLRDVLGWPFVEHPESESGWLIFKTGPSEMGVHPTSGTHEGEVYSYPRQHLVSLMCDDIEATVAELEARGAEFSGPPEDAGFGVGTHLKVPGAGEILLYEPRHPEAYNL